MGKPERKRPLAKRRHMLKDIDLRQIGCDGMDWIYLAEDRDQ
jgi:hypothetical protein